MIGGDLRSRLARFDRVPVQPPLTGESPRMSMAARMRRLMALGISGATLRGGAGGKYLRIEAKVDRSRWPGPPQHCVDAESWHRLQRGVFPSGDHWAVLDTETTGLQSGTGTLVFLVGVLHWTKRGARLVQYLLPEPAGEEQMFRDLQRDLSRSDALLTFNGSSFDLPLLRTRALLLGIDSGFLDRPHLDLVHPARRVASPWLDNCRLSSLECQWLQRPRHEDVSGSEVPAIYRNWLHEGETSGLLKVLRHNRQDVENLLALAALLAAIYGEGSDPLVLPPASQLAVGRALLSRGRAFAAQARLKFAAAHGRGLVARRASSELTCLLKRQRQWGEAEANLRKSVKRWPGWIWPRVEIAKLQEHREKNFEAALRTVDFALRVLARQQLLEGGQDRMTWKRELEHRRKRLFRRKAGREG